MVTALTISAVAIYYSVAGLVAIFAAAAIPIIIMGSALEIAKLVTAVWLHRYWSQTTWWLKTYLSAAVIVLMFITSLGIFGFLSKAHIEQTANANEGVAQIERIDTEIARQNALIARSEDKISKAESSTGNRNSDIQQQINIEQERIDTAYSRIQPAIDEQNAIIEAARAADAKRTEPFEQQLTNLSNEILRLEEQARQYEQRITELKLDTSTLDPVITQITALEESIVKVESQLSSGERDQISLAQRTIGANVDGSSGPATRRAADTWISQQKIRINNLNAQLVDLRTQAQNRLNEEKNRLANLVSDIRTSQIQNIKIRESELLSQIDSVRATESPTIKTARDEIARLRQTADQVVAQSQALIQQLRESLTIGSDDDVETIVQTETQKIRDANLTIDNLTEQRYTLEAEYRKLEAEVGPIKYLAEFIYGNTADTMLLEEAVRWVIIIIIFVFDPLAVLLLIASQYTFDYHRKSKKAEIKDEPVETIISTPPPTIIKKKSNRKKPVKIEAVTSQDEQQESNIVDVPTEIINREQEYKNKEQTKSFRDSKNLWKEDHPNETLKVYKAAYIEGKIDKLPWEGYKQNEEQNETSLFNKIRANDSKN